MPKRVIGIRAEDSFFERAEKCAKSLGISRNKLIVMIVSTYCDLVENKNGRK